MKDLPKIDVVMPIGHWSPHLAATLASLKAQSSYFDLIVQDASGDDRVENDFTQSGLTIQQYCKEPDNGQADAIAKGWSKSDNEIVFWLNADDMLMPTTMDFVQKSFAKNGALDVLCGQSTISNNDGAILGLHPEVTSISPLLKRSNIISQPSCFVRRAAMEQVGGVDAELEYTMDWDLWLRLYLADVKFEYVDNVFSNVTWETGTKTSRIPLRRLKEIYKLLRRSSSSYTALKGIIGVFQHHRDTYLDARVDLSTRAEKIQEMPVLNLSSQRKDRLKIHINKLSGNTKISCLNSQITRENKGFTVEFDQPIEPLQCVYLSVNCQAGTPDIFKSARWE